MLFPQCGKVLVIDDQIEEAMPLLNLLGKKGVSSMYYSGSFPDLPEKPFDGIRLVFCDLKFNVASDPKSVASNVYAILNSLISESNGPYILLVWSAHGTDYLEELRKVLQESRITPEFVLQLNKGDFFSSTYNDKFFDDIIEALSELDLDRADEDKVKKLIEKKTSSHVAPKREPIPNALEKIEEKLKEELKKVNLFHLFVLWENTISKAAIETVNSIYKAIPESVPEDKKLRAMLFYLARYRLEKQIGDADEDTKFRAAMDSLNELFSYFYSEQVHMLSLDKVEADKILEIKEIRELSDAKFNQWKMLASSNKGHHPGNMYKDISQSFKYHGLLKPDMFTKPEEYNKIVEELEKNSDITYVLVDISSDCDIAQKKLFVSRVVPGIMIPEDCMKTYQEQGKLKQGNFPEYIFDLPNVEFEGKNWYILFNVNQMFAVQMDELNDDNLICAITGSYVTALKQQAAICVSKQGKAFFNYK